MSYSNCEIPSFWDLTEPKARKPHGCCECRARIAVGERYVKCVGVWAGEFNTYRQHQICAEACETIRDRFNDDECISFGDLGEWWNDSGRHLPKDREHVAKLRGLMARILARERRG